MKNKITILSLALALTGCVTKVENTMVLEGCDAGVENLILKNTANNETALDKQTLLNLLPGSTVYQDKADFVQVGFYAEDNTMTGNVWGSWEDHIDKGSWSVNEEGQFCNQWQGVWSQSKEHSCYQVFPGDIDNQYVMVPNSDDKETLQVLISPQNGDEFE